LFRALEARLPAALQVSVLGLHLGEGGVSYASFSDADAAERVKVRMGIDGRDVGVSENRLNP